MKSEYKALIKNLEEISQLNGAMGILHWDQEVIMPPGATKARANQMSALAGVIHEKISDTKIGNWLNEIDDKGLETFDIFERTNILEAKRDYNRQVNIPKKLVQEMAKLKALSHPIWVKARNENRFNDFAPCLKRWVELKIEWAHCIDPNKSAYDVNIDEYERNENTERLDKIFTNLKDELIPLIRSIQNSKYQPEKSFLSGDFPINKQKELTKKISTDMGFDFACGRMDISVHPFCGGGHPTDVRLTTRYQPNNFVESLYAAIHETGHGLYEQGRMGKGLDLPASEALSMGIHESQSLFWERMIAQNYIFTTHYLKIFVSIFPDQLRDINQEKFYKAINTCCPSYIRVEADEVTYPMHVALRYEIEKSLFDGSISVDQLPNIWNEKMNTYLGLPPPNDKDGVLQDIHWSMGAFGYFPSYTLGSIYACQFFNAINKDIPEIDNLIGCGKLLPIKLWLNEKVHKQGRLYSTNELVENVTGTTLNTDQFIYYLKDKYSEIYQL